MLDRCSHFTPFTQYCNVYTKTYLSENYHNFQALIQDLKIFEFITAEEMTNRAIKNIPT